MQLNPRVYCVNGISLSVQANQYAYCSPRNNSLSRWEDYDCVEVGFIQSAPCKPYSPPESWKQYADGDFPSDVYGYVPVNLVKEFIQENGGYALNKK